MVQQNKIAADGKWSIAIIDWKNVTLDAFF